MGLSLGAHYYGLFRDQQIILLSLALFKQSMFVFAILLGKVLEKDHQLAADIVPAHTSEKLLK